MKRRHFDRVPFDGQVLICRRHEATAVRPLDVGAGGMRLVAPAPLPSRSFLTLALRLPGHIQPLVVLARVIRTEGVQAAVEFLGLRPSQRDMLNGLARSAT